MDEVVINPKVKAAMQQFTTRPTHSLLLVGPLGAGKTTLAELLLSQLLGLTDVGRLHDYPYYTHVEPQGGSISIETVRNLRELVSLKTPGQRSVRRAVLLEDAHLMTLEAQNAILKLLEEPPLDTVLVLTTPRSQDLLPTIVSRVPKIDISPPPKAALTEHFKAMGYQLAAIESAYYLADGQPGLMSGLLHDDKKHPLAAQITVAKKLLSASLFDRLSQIDSLAKQKAALPELLFALKRICHAALHQASSKNDPSVGRWHRALSAVLRAETALLANPSPKLLLSDLLLTL